MKFKAGQTVHVKVAGLIIPGIIKEVSKSGEYIVQFEGGSEKSVSEKSIKPVDGHIPRIELNAPKPDSRSQNRRSPSRRSPARSRGKTSPSPTRRSPSRQKNTTTSTSPARKSPGRSRKLSPSPARTKLISRNITPTRILKISLENIDGCGDYSLRKRKLAENASESEKLETVTHDNIIESVIPSPLPVETNEDIFQEKEVYLNQKNDNLINDISKFSDDDDITEIKLPTRERKSESKLMRPPKEFGGWIGAFVLIFLIPLSVLSLHILCNKQCSFVEISDLQPYKLHETYLDFKALYTYIGYIIFISVLSQIPYIGKKINNQPSKDKIFSYKMNGLSSAFVILAILIILENQNISAINFLTDRYFQLMVSSLIFASVVSILLFIKSKFVPLSLLNPYGSTYNFIYDFFMGRQINPKFFNIDVKIVLLRSSYITALIFNSIYLMKATNVFVQNENFLSVEKITFEPTFFICTVLQIFYILDFLFFENQLTTTFELQYEGLGYMKTMLYAANPFYLTITTKYLYESNFETQYSLPALIAICLLYLAGYIMYRGSNSQKNAFRLNPYDPALSHLESMSTGQGKKLLISGWWGHLRHPNYCGDIILHLSIGALCAGSPAGLGILPPALMLAIRAVRDSNRCRRRYGTAWERYTQKVRYSIIPLVY